MRRAFKAIILVSVGCGLGSCGGGDSHQSVAEDMTSLIESISDIIETVSDEETAKTAVGKIQGMEEQLQNLAERQADLGTPDSDEKKALDEKFRPRLEEARDKMTETLAKLDQQHPNAAKLVKEAMAKAGESIRSLDPTE